MTILALIGWEKFQHYKDRDPPWVKLYRDVLTTESWVLGTDSSRLLQVASVLLAARYGNKIPYRWDLIKKVAHLDLSESQFKAAVQHLVDFKFLEFQEVTSEAKHAEQSASAVLATCTSETETEAEQRESRGRAEKISVGQEPDGGAVERVFSHWKTVHGHPKANLDAKRRRMIQQALAGYSEADVCLSITGYKNSPHHMGANERSMVYDDIGLFLRDAQHIEAGMRCARSPATTPTSSLTRRNVEATADWVPPEMRRAAV